MKLLIITSERLNPGNILSSTFELTQAIILSKHFEVAIISVDLQASFSSRIKNGIKNILSAGSSEKPANTTSAYSIWRIIRTLFVSSSPVRYYVINQIPVFEGVASPWRSPKTFLQELKIWMKAGFAAFESYHKKYISPDIVHAHGRFLYAGALALEIKKKNKIRYIYTEHSTYFQRSLVPSDAIPVCREIIKEANVYTVVSKALLSHVETLLQSKYPQAKIVPNALDLIFEQPLNKRPERKEFNFTVIASLDHKKGIDLLLKAFNNLIKNYPQLRLNICGEGPMKKDIEKFIEDHHLKDRVLLLGKKSKEEVLELLDIHTDVFVLPSREETFGVVVIEAISRGIPVIATRSGGPEFIINKDCGFLIEPGDPEIIYSAMNDMLTKYIWFDKNQIRKYAIDAFGSKTFLLTMDKIYSEIKDDRNN